MEITTTTVVYIIAGLLALMLGVLTYSYFNGGLQNNTDLLLGLLR